MTTTEQARAARCRVLPGFPVESALDTPEKLAEYFGRDSLVCLLCGKSYRALGKHLECTHGVEPDDYRARYGIPWSRGLVCLETSGLFFDNATERMRDGTLDIASLGNSQRGKKQSGNQLRQRIERSQQTLANLRRIGPPRTHCKRGHQLAIPGEKHCAACATYVNRLNHGHLPRDVAAKTMVPATCVECGAEYTHSRLANNRSGRCGECSRQYYRRYHAAYGAWARSGKVGEFKP